jgi:hypothetical protein
MDRLIRIQDTGAAPPPAPGYEQPLAVAGFPEPVVRLRTVGLALTMQCNFECVHCITESSPQVRSALSDGEAEQLIADIPAHSARICFTGGETTLKLDMLLRGIRQSRLLGLVPTIVTNGHWARTEKQTAQMLEKLVRAGLIGICVSLDRFHLEFTSSENALRISKMSAEVGLLHVVRMCYTKLDDFASDFMARHKDAGVNFQAVRVLRLGRARTLPVDVFESDPELPDHNCGTVISPLAMPDGLVQACCGPGIEFTRSNPLNLGNWREEPLADILRRGRANPFVMIMNNKGPMELVRQLQARGFDPLNGTRRATYSGICDLCIDLLNCPSTVAASNAAFADPQLQMQMVAGQVYQQAVDHLQREKAKLEVAG